MLGNQKHAFGSFWSEWTQGAHSVRWMNLQKTRNGDIAQRKVFEPFFLAKLAALDDTLNKTTPQIEDRCDAWGTLRAKSSYTLW